MIPGDGGRGFVIAAIDGATCVVLFVVYFAALFLWELALKITKKDMKDAGVLPGQGREEGDR